MSSDSRRLSSVCVYCASSSAVASEFTSAAESFGTILAREDLRLVYGGGGVGLMGACARAAHAAGGRVLGVIPHFLTSHERPLKMVDTIVVGSMHERKMMMFEEADAFAVLPGGIGTLEELVEQMTWAQLGRHEKPILIADINGFWRPLLSLLAHMRESGFVRAGLEVRYLVAERIEDALEMIETAAKRNEANGEAEKQRMQRM